MSQRPVEEMLEDWEPVIGLEVHVQLATQSKAFSGSAVAFGAEPNSLTDPTVLGLPGSLPTFNLRALECALKLGVATSSKIRAKSRFARKHYFYPDLPKGYQITQFDEPLCEDGHLDLILDKHIKRVKLTRIHLEEDAGKNTHVGAISHVDLNRAGIPLVEVVSEPEMTSAEEAAEFMRALHRLVRWLDISEADMEKGQLRCDANVSIRRRGEDRLGTRTELKNINSFRFVHHAIEHEIARQLRIIESGGTIERETRLWDAEAGQSQTMRTKEEANDYRYFPDPDLPPLVVDGQTMGAVLKSLPELPTPRFVRYQTELGLAAADARTIVSDLPLAAYFEAAAAVRPKSGRLIANWMLGELMGLLNAEGVEIADAKMTPATLAALVGLVEDGTISGKIGKDVFEESYRTGGSAGRDRRAPRRPADQRRADAVGDHRPGGQGERQAGRGLRGGQGRPVRVLRGAGHEGDGGPCQPRDDHGFAQKTTRTLAGERDLLDVRPAIYKVPRPRF